MEKFEEKIPGEGVGRKGLPLNLGPEEMKFVDEGEKALKESEQKWKEQHAQAFVPIEEVPDPDTLHMEGRVIEEMDSGLPYGVTEADLDEEFKAWHETQEASGVSRPPSPLPPEIRHIIRSNSVSAEAWAKMSKEGRGALKNKIQAKIQEHYLSAPKKMVHRKPKQTA